MSKRSKVHPTYKTRYRVTNWPEYDRALVRRGDLTIWFTPAALRTWTPLPTGERGGQRRYSDPCVELALTLKLLFGLPWRSVEGLLGSLFHFVGLEAPIPDHTTLSRRARGLDVPLQALPGFENGHPAQERWGGLWCTGLVQPTCAHRTDRRGRSSLLASGGWAAPTSQGREYLLPIQEALRWTIDR